MTDASTTLRAGRREWLGLAVLALPCLVYAMDLTVLNLAVPKLSEDLQPSSAQLLWIVDIYGFLVAGLLVTMGTLGDRIGRRRLLLAGAAAFAVASVLAAWSTSAGMLIAARALLGVAGATLAPSTLSLIRNMFADPRQRTVAVSVWITSFAVGGAVGPLVGGVLLEWFWWGSVFLVAVPVMALLLVLGPRLLPEFRDPAAGRLDLGSAALSLAAVLAAIYGLKQLAQDGPGWLAVGCMLAGLLVGVGFVRRQRRLADPLIDVRLLGNRAFSAALTTNLLSFCVGFGALLFTAQYLQLVLGLSPLEAGLWSLPSSAGFILGSMATPLLVRRAAPVAVMAAGLALAAVGFGLLTQLPPSSGLPLLVTGSVIFSLALAPVDTLATDLAVGAAPPERAGAASAITETSAEFGGALGIAVLGVIGTAVYRAQMAEAVPAGVPTRRQRRPVTPWAGRWRWPANSPSGSARPCWRWPGRRSPRACTWPLPSAPRPRWPSPSWSSSCSEAYAQAPNPTSNRTLRQDPAGPGEVGSSKRPGRRPVPDSDTTRDEDHAVTVSRGADAMGRNDPDSGETIAAAG